MLANMFLTQMQTARPLPGSKGGSLLARLSCKATSTLCVLMLLLMSVSSVRAQVFNLTYNPAVVCEGNNAILTISPPVGLPAGVTVLEYVYHYNDPTTGGPDSAITPNLLQVPHIYPPGVYYPQVIAKLSDGTRLPSNIDTLTVYHKPIAGFIPLTNLNQCFKDNQSCFQNISAQASSPSSPIAQVVWEYGDAFSDSVTHLNNMCHSYGFSGQFLVVLRVLDSLGCRNDAFLPPLTPVNIKPNLEPKFKWVRLSGPCVVSKYKFTNLTVVDKGTVQKYTWYFGDGSTYTATAPFLGPSFDYFDTISHDYIVNGKFPPALTITDTTGCTDSIMMTDLNSAPLEIPKNIVFTIDIVTTKSATDASLRDSVCIGSHNSSEVCFRQTPIEFISPSDILWEFDDPASMQLNVDNTTWSPCHTFVGGLNTYYPKLHILSPCPNTYTYYSTITLNDDKFIDKHLYLGNDTLDGARSQPRALSDTMRVSNAKFHKTLYYQHEFVISEDKSDTSFVFMGNVLKPTYLISTDSIVYDQNGNIKDSISLYPISTIINNRPPPQTSDTFSVFNYWAYGLRVIGPFARIPDPPNGVVIKSQQMNQCGPTTAVDFVNTSLYYKSRMMWRRWDFDDDFAPQCTSFSIPKFGFPPVHHIEPQKIITFNNGLTYDTLYVDTVRMWVDAEQQYLNSDHYFIANGATYGGKMWCKFSYDTLPRHLYPNWDTVFRWYSGGHDFMPWDTGRYGPSGTIPVNPADAAWWGKPIYLDPVNGQWSLVQNTGPAPYGQWVRIDTMELKYNNGQDLDIGEPIQLRNVPDPYRSANPNGSYNVISGGSISLNDSVTYKFNGKTYTIRGFDLLPGSPTTFYKYAFLRMITRCMTVKLRLKDSLNNETTLGTVLDSTKLDTADCNMEATVTLPFAKADARGLAKRGRECPGFSPNGPFFEMGPRGNFPGVKPSCGQTFIMFNFDSLADRFDNTPCDLDAFVTYSGAMPNPGVNSVTAGGLVFPPFFTAPNFNQPPTMWQSPGSTVIAWHYGLNAGTRPPPADTALGWITVGLVIGSGIKTHTEANVDYNQYITQLSYYGDNSGAFPNPGIKSIIDVPVGYGPTGAPTTYNYQFSQLVNFRTVPIGGNFIDLVDIEYIDPTWPHCLSDTVWYHRFLRINNLTAKFEVDPINCRLRHKGEQITVHYEDSIQDEIKYSTWAWGDNTVTVDSFYYSPDSLPDLTDGYYINGVRRVRYNFDLQSGFLELLDSTVWPIRASGIGANDGLRPGMLTANVAYNLIDKCTGGTNPNPTMVTVDSALMFFPITHTFVRTSWEAGGKGADAKPQDLLHLIGSRRGCFQSFPIQMTIGIIDTFDILNGQGKKDTTYCENEDVFFIDSLRYWRLDCQLTQLPFVPAVTNGPAYKGPLADFPLSALQIDTADFWRHDAGDPNPIQNIIITQGYQFPKFGKWDTVVVVPERVYWDFGDGSPIDSSVRPVHKYASYGRYKVTMVSKDSIQGFDTCVGYLNISRPVAKIGFTNDGAGIPKDVFNCGDFADMIDSSTMDPSTVSGFLDSVKGNWWWFGENKLDTVPFESKDNYFPKWRYRNNGLFRVKLVVETFQGCTDTTWDSVFIRGPRPEFQLIDPADTIGCAPFKVRLKNLADSSGKFVTPNGLNMLSDTPTITTYYDWGDTITKAPQTIVTGRRDTVEFTYLNPGVYYIYGYGSDAEPGKQNSCELQVYPDTLVRPKIKITVLDLQRDITLDKDVICKDRPVNIINNSDTLYTSYSYVISRNEIDMDSTTNPSPGTHSQIFNDTGTYRIIARPETMNPLIPLHVQNNCKANDTLNLKVVAPIPTFGIDTMETPVFHLINSSDTTINSEYIWDVKKMGTTTSLFNTPYNGNNQNRDFTFDLGPDTGSYIVCLTSKAKGIDPVEACQETVCDTVKVTFTINVEVPNVFSPNGDGINDVFNIRIEGEQKYKVVVYNRWGAKMFESGDAKTMWNGKVLNDGAEAPAGVYYFIFDYQLRSQQDKTRTGTVTLIR
jgi:gliding motility-associated-like protein